jgi:hypothetical protein
MSLVQAIIAQFPLGLGAHFRRIKLGSGVVGKTSKVIWGLIPLWAIVLWRLSDNLMLNLFLVAGGIIITAFVMWWVHGTHKFADKNPSVALLEGAELIEYKKFEAQVKGVGALTDAQAQLQQDPNLIVIPAGNPQSMDL